MGCKKGQVFEFHGMSRTRAYRIWSSMLKRCHNPGHVAFSRYGGRGIAVCAEWRHSFITFFKDMGNPPEGMTLDRKNSDLGYGKANCRWASPAEQARNRRNNRMVTAFGETHSACDWAADPRCKVEGPLLCKRLLMGWSTERAISEPPNPIKNTRRFRTNAYAAAKARQA